MAIPLEKRETPVCFVGLKWAFCRKHKRFANKYLLVSSVMVSLATKDREIQEVRRVIAKDRYFGFSNDKYRIDTKASQATSMRPIMLKTVTLVLVENANGKQPFLVSEDGVVVGDTVCELTDSSAWVLATIHDAKEMNSPKQKKVVATPDQIGYLVLRKSESTVFHDTDSSTSARELSQEDVAFILDRDGQCAIEMETFEGAYCGFRTIRYHNGKVLIHLQGARALAHDWKTAQKSI